MKRMLSLLIALILTLSLALAETADDYAVATINGEHLLFSKYNAIESAYLYQYESAGVDLTNPDTYTYVQDLALTHAIEQMLVKQDMQAQSCYDFDEETEIWFTQTGKAAYEAALSDVKSALYASDPTLAADELTVYALAYAQNLGVTEQTYIDYYRDQYASVRYYEWLTRDNPVTDEDVKASYDARVANSKALYENNIAAFEKAMYNGEEVWYKPAGYRSVLQILLPTQGETEDDRLASVQTTVDLIYARLEKGETFQSLVTEYCAGESYASEEFLSSGYQVHQESIYWEDAFISAAFSNEMAQPGCWSKPFVSDLGVHILYYLCDSVPGPIEMTQEIHDALHYTLYVERYSAAQSQRINELADAAVIVIH